MKTCNKCQKTKSLTEFHKNATGSQGVRSVCRACKNKTQRREGSVMERLVARTQIGDGCHLWCGGKTSNGYGMLGDGAKMRSTHRLAWELFRGAIPEGAMVLHHCDVRHCVNPDHLYIGNHADNMRDRTARGRGTNATDRPEAFKRGNDLAWAKLDPAKVREIRRRATAETHQAIADSLSVSRSAVSQVISRRTWRQVA